MRSLKIHFPQKLLEIKMSTVAENRKIIFDKNKIAEFYPTLRKRVDEYFSKHNLSTHANGAMVFKTIFILGVFIASYVLVIIGILPLWAMLISILIHGFFTALVGFNISHDAVHGSYSSNVRLNKILGTTFNFAGTSDYIWKIKHNIVHHTFTNIPEHDDDIDQIGLIRIEQSRKLKWYHRFQHYYVFLLYCFTTIVWVFVNDYKNFFRKKWGYYENNKHPKGAFLRIISYKAIYYFCYLVLPFLVMNIAWYWILVGFVLMHAIQGLTLAIVFQLAHVVEDAAFPTLDENDKVENNWAVHQLYTTVDFARNSPLVRFLVGGLNFQVEHHLFPKICHIHYKKIAPIVKQTAEEFNLPYLESKTFGGALLSHIRLMRKLGREESFA